HVVPLEHELARARGRQRDAVLVRLDLPCDADTYDARMLVDRREPSAGVRATNRVAGGSEKRCQARCACQAPEAGELWCLARPAAVPGTASQSRAASTSASV